MNLRRKIALFTVVLAAVICFLPPKAYAAEGDLAESQSFWDKVKNAGSAAADYVGEHKDGWIESAKNGASTAADKASELYDAAKEAAPGVIDAAKDAHQQFVDWNNRQCDEVVAWSEGQIYGSGGTVGDSATTSSATTGSATGAAPNGNGQNGNSQSNPAPSGSVTGDQTTTTAPGGSQSNPPATATVEPPASSDDAQIPNLPGYEMSSDGKTVTIDGEEYTKLDDADKWALKDGRMRQWTFFYIGLPILGVVGVIWIIAEIRGARKPRRKR